MNHRTTSAARAVLAAAALLALAPARAAEVMPVTEDVMTSSFFTGANRVRGYGAESTRPVLRVSTLNPAGTIGAETLYLSFAHDFSAYSGPVAASTFPTSSTAGSTAATGSRPSRSPAATTPRAMTSCTASSTTTTVARQWATPS